MPNNTQKPVRFRATLLAEPDGGHAVVVPQEVREKLGGASRLRVRGTIEGIEFRSVIMRYSGIPYLGVHKATVQKGNLHGGQEVEIEVEVDLEAR
jgi:hypothetical protein